MKKQLTISVAILTLGVGVLAGVSPFLKQAAPVNPERTAQIQVFANGFMPGTITVKPNTAVTWVDEVNPNEGVVLSASTSKDATGAIIESNTPQEKGFTRIFAKPGKYTFHSPTNPDVTGTIIVE